MRDTYRTDEYIRPGHSGSREQVLVDRTDLSPGSSCETKVLARPLGAKPMAWNRYSAGWTGPRSVWSMARHGPTASVPSLGDPL